LTAPEKGQPSASCADQAIDMSPGIVGTAVHEPRPLSKPAFATISPAVG
jgi:hypothetical protein